MKDVFGTEIEVGDRVATNVRGYTDHLVKGTVQGFTSQKVRIVMRNGDTYLKYPYQLAIGVKNGISGQEKEEPR